MEILSMILFVLYKWLIKVEIKSIINYPNINMVIKITYVNEGTRDMIVYLYNYMIE